MLLFHGTGGDRATIEGILRDGLSDGHRLATSIRPNPGQTLAANLWARAADLRERRRAAGRAVIFDQSSTAPAPTGRPSQSVARRDDDLGSHDVSRKWVDNVGLQPQRGKR